MEILSTIDKFYIGSDLDSPQAEIEFETDADNNVVVTHTYVSDVFKGQGVGKKLVNAVVDFARENNRKIVPICSFAKAILEKSEEYADVLVRK